MSDRLIDRIRAGEWYSVNSRTSLIAEFDAIEQERDFYKSVADPQQKAILSLTEQVNSLKEQLGIVENACQDWRERAESAEAEVKTLCTNIGILRTELSKEHAEVKATEKRYASLEKEWLLQSKVMESTRKKWQEAEASVKFLEEGRDETNKALYKTCGEVVDLQAEVKRLDDLLSWFEMRFGSFGTYTHADILKKIDEQEAEVKKLQTEAGQRLYASELTVMLVERNKLLGERLAKVGKWVEKMKLHPHDDASIETCPSGGWFLDEDLYDLADILEGGNIDPCKDCIVSLTSLNERLAKAQEHIKVAESFVRDEDWGDYIASVEEKALKGASELDV